MNSDRPSKDLDAETIQRESASNAQADVSVLIVNYNTGHLLEEMWHALEQSRGSLALRTIIVDNASRDESIAVIKQTIPNANLISNAVNVGFARANNQALAVAPSTRYVLLLNTDAFVAPDTLSKTVAYMDAHTNCGILGVRLVGRESDLQPSCRYFPTPLNVFLSRTGLAKFFPHVRLVDDMSWNHGNVRECDWVPGCYFLIRAEVLQAVHCLDPRYFLYYEEVDFCFAAKRAGWNVTFFPDTEVVHIGGESAKSDAKLTKGLQIQELQIESELLFFRKNYGYVAVLLSLMLSVVADAILLTKHVLRGGPRTGVSSYWRHSAEVFRSFIRTRWGSVASR